MNSIIKECSQIRQLFDPGAAEQRAALKVMLSILAVLRLIIVSA